MTASIEGVPTDGYRRRPPVVRLTFEAEDLAGLVVRCEHVAVAELLAVQNLLDGDLRFVPENEDELRDAAGRMTSTVVEWNLQDRNGAPTPATADGLLSHDPLFVQQLIAAWCRGLTQAPPRPRPASHDPAEVEALDRMATLAATAQVAS